MNNFTVTVQQPINYDSLLATLSTMKQRLEFLELDVPEHPYIEYEPSDMDWMLYFGFATKKPKITHLLANPDMLQRLTDSVGVKGMGHALAGLPIREQVGVPDNVVYGINLDYFEDLLFNPEPKGGQQPWK